MIAVLLVITCTLIFVKALIDTAAQKDELERELEDAEQLKAVEEWRQKHRGNAQ